MQSQAINLGHLTKTLFYKIFFINKPIKPVNKGGDEIIKGHSFLPFRYLELH